MCCQNFGRTLCTLLSLASTSEAAALVPRSSDLDDRSWQAAVQDINGIISIITLLPVLTGKTQIVKLIASRILSASFVMAGIGAGRVLAKLQMGLLLCSFSLYRNIIGDISYPHHEYVNNFSPKLDHIPTGTPERHAQGAYINHNAVEVYMVEAWFRTQGEPAILELRNSNVLRILCAFGLYLCLYIGETYLAMQNAALNCGNVFMAIQAISAVLWLIAIMIDQWRRGRCKDEIFLNDTTSTQYRCFRLPLLGHHVSSSVLSFQLNNLHQFQLFQSNYEQPFLVTAGIIILISGVLDMFSTVLVVGKTTWAYLWIGTELLIIVTKVLFCLEPLRFTEIKRVRYETTGLEAHASTETETQLPLEIQTSDEWHCQVVTVSSTILRNHASGQLWVSSTPGVYVGQQYFISIKGQNAVKYLAFVGNDNKIGLIDEIPIPQSNLALQREFLAAVACIVVANKVPSREFLAAIDTLISNIKENMNETWFRFGAKEVIDAVSAAKKNRIWRSYM